jgi:thiamine pyrophosphokinase
MIGGKEGGGGRPGKEAFIFLNGPFERPRDLPDLPPEGALVMAVDGGALHSLSLGWPLDVLLGDFDSLPSKALELLKARHRNLRVETFPKDKDETDFELALRLLDPMARAFSKVTILGGLGGRWDMTLANLLSPLASSLGLLEGPRKPDLAFREGNWSLHLLKGPGELRLSPSGEPRRVSLIPVRGEAEGASLSGAFKYPLARGVLSESLTKGLSNELGHGGGIVSIERGILIVSVSPLSDEGFARKAPDFS